MPVLNKTNMSQYTGPNFNFKGARLDTLGATEYTIVTVAVDVSGSVMGFAKELESSLQSVVEACQLSPRADRLMIRLLTFGSSVSEVHGFKELSTCNLADYQGILHCGGLTALCDACGNAVEATSQYGQDLANQRFDANALIVVITDGGDNNSKLTRNYVKDALERTIKEEHLESIKTILVGVGNDVQYWNQFANDVGFDQTVATGDASKRKLAKLANFVSKSISAQSQALGTGGPSQSLTF